MRVAVVGHVEWIEFARVERVPKAGEIVHASETWEAAAGGGAVAAVQHWADAGASAAQINLLENTRIHVTDLPNSGGVWRLRWNGLASTACWTSSSIPSRFLDAPTAAKPMIRRCWTYSRNMMPSSCS